MGEAFGEVFGPAFGPDRQPRPVMPGLEVAYRATLGQFAPEVSFAIGGGPTVLFGFSGSGKTTTLRVVAGLIRAREARIAVNGRVLTDSTSGLSLRPALRRIGLVAQRPALFPHLTVAQNIGFGLQAIRTQSARRERVHEALSVVGGLALAGKMPSSLSGGEQQRVALARAIAPEPELLLLDEPLTGLHGEVKEELLHRLLAWLQPRALPLLYVTHDLAETALLGGSVLLLREGRVAAHGAALEVLATEWEAARRQLNRIP